MKNISSIQSATSQPKDLAALQQAYRSWSNTSDPFSRLTRRLATTLSLETQLGILAEELGNIIPFDSLTYRHQIGHRDFVYATGIGGPHRCEYRLNLEGVCYGTLSVNRRQKFSDDELQGIEMIISAAVCSLRNACQFITIEQAALTDALTSIPNKRALDEQLQRACSLADRHAGEYSLILCDLDHFKSVNDQQGHVVGDHMLRLAASTLEAAIRNSDSVYRFGGEEFAILLPHTGELEARDVADRVRNAIADLRVDCGGTELSVTISCGVTRYMPGESADQWIARADEALYRAKEQGRNCTRVFATIG
ncbi:MULTISPECIES: GGDEF domain-containing protein [unclassified Marinobacter]|uniref:GGDEF domain-containing protein n=1 Tax=unclassified Marinobacter TaxID=83889 RepID=UPI0026E4593A|nr:MULTISPECIES: GGDEF domain-containing protein [unclassified Marinobacter]MDO6442172.1 GGDEF domain-containing protein [Marinobacter sp. 2_MG-2023]MDO6825062.1 GGDEF domain-containing protein [Marinobacter sp. 1_MG-2023]